MKILSFKTSQIILVFADPTSNVAPRYAGERYEGWKLVEMSILKTVALNCAIQGSPVPVTRYVKTLGFSEEC
jgi:hypothetical protein